MLSLKSIFQTRYYANRPDTQHLVVYQPQPTGLPTPAGWSTNASLPIYQHQSAGFYHHRFVHTIGDACKWKNRVKNIAEPLDIPIKIEEITIFAWFYQLHYHGYDPNITSGISWRRHRQSFALWCATDATPTHHPLFIPMGYLQRKRTGMFPYRFVLCLDSSF